MQCARVQVTRLDRDPSSGTSMQEMNFWLNLERALARIQEKREGPEVTLTLEMLRHAKRFHATVSFDADTGLKSAVAIVADYTALMKVYLSSPPLFASPALLPHRFPQLGPFNSATRFPFLSRA